MPKKQYILLKDTPELKKGAILEERCDDGSQGFACNDLKSMIVPEKGIQVTIGRKEVTTQPQWFEEIYQVSVPKRYVIKVQKYIKGLK